VIAATDGVTIVQPTTPSSARWVQSGLKLSYEPTWWIDLVTGSDTNDGLTQATALKTTEEWSRRLFPNGSKRVFYPSLVTVNIGFGAVGSTPSVAQTQGAIYINADWSASISLFGAELRIVYAIQSSSAITIATSTTNTSSTDTRGQLSTASGSFVAQGRIRVLTGANVGAVGYSAGLNGDTQHTFTGDFQNYYTESLSYPAVGNTVCVDTLLVTQRQTVIRTAGKGYVTLQDAKIAAAFFESDSLNNTDSGGGGWLNGCEFNSAFISAPAGAGFFNCKFTGTTTVRGENVVGFNNYIQGVLLSSARQFDCDSPMTVDGGSVWVGFSSTSQVVPGCSFRFAQPTQFVNGGAATAGIHIASGCIGVCGTALWGPTSASTYPIGIDIQNGGWFYSFSATAQRFLSTVNFQIASKSYPWAAFPVNVTQAHAGAIYGTNPTSTTITWQDVPFVTVPDNTTRDAIPAAVRQEGMLVYSKTTKLVYQLASNLTTWNAIANSPETGSQSAWSIDSATGNDSNSGLPGSPLATAEEMSRRLSCRGQRTPLTTNVTITFGAGTYGTLALTYELVSGTSLTIVGNVTTSSPIVLSSVTNESVSTTSPVRGQVATASGTFVAHTQMRVTTGAQANARAFCAELNGDAQHVFTSGWFGFLSGVTTPPSAGDSVVFDTRNTTINVIDLSPHSAGPTSQSTTVQDLIVGRLANVADCEYRSSFLTNGGAVFWVGVEWANNSRLQGSPSWVYQSRNLGAWYVSGYGSNGAVGIDACSIQGVLYHLPGTKVYYGDVANNVVDGGTIAVGAASTSDIIGGAFARMNSIQFCNGGSATAAIILADGARCQVGTMLWGGTSASVYPIGVQLNSGSWFGVTTAASNVNIPSTINYQVTGHNLAFSALPTCYPRANCGLYLSPDPAAAAVTT
jgi:hypothetical protein